MKKYFLALAIIVSIISSLKGQNAASSDTLSKEKTRDSVVYEYDTVVLEKDPLIIKKQIVIQNVIPKPKPRFSADLYYSPFIISKTDQTFNDGPAISTSIGGAVNMNYKGKLISIGFSVTEIKGYESYEDSSSYYKKDTIDIYYIVKEEDTTWVYETKDNKYTSTFKKKNLNQYSYFELPVLLGLYKTKGRVTYSCKAGGIIGVPIKVQGIMAKNRGLEKEQLHKNDLITVQLSLFVGGTISYRVVGKMSVFANGYVRRGLTEVYKSKRGGELLGVGLKAGINYFF